MDQIIKWTIVLVIGLMLGRYYWGIIRDYRRERKISYIMSSAFLLMGNDGNLLSLTVEKQGFDAQVHYAHKTNALMVVDESEDII